MKSTKNTVHISAICHDCGMTFQDYKTGMKDAEAHASKEKHTVRGEMAIAFEYNGKKK